MGEVVYFRLVLEVPRRFDHRIGDEDRILPKRDKEHLFMMLSGWSLGNSYHVPDFRISEESHFLIFRTPMPVLVP